MDKLNALKTYIGKCEEAESDAGVKTCLQSEPGISSRYMAYRWVQFVMHLAILVGAMLELYTGTVKMHAPVFYAKWLLYLTSWVLVLNMVQSLMGAVILTMAYLRRGRAQGRTADVYGVSGKLVDIYRAMYSVAVNFAVFMAFGYWELRIGLPKALTAEKMKVFGCYGLSAFLMLADLFIVQFPYRMKTGLYALAAMTSYFLATWVHFVTGSLDAYKKTHYIYPGLDWSNPAVAVKHAAVCVLMLEVLNCSSLWALCQLRRYILNKYAPMQTEPEPVPIRDIAHPQQVRHHHSFESSQEHPAPHHEHPVNHEVTQKKKKSQ